MREATGIITEEAGTNSHSAIVGLTLDKAVIVGAHQCHPHAEGRHDDLWTAPAVLCRRWRSEADHDGTYRELLCVDHTKLLPGMYLSRQDGENGEILTWDIRMKQPNKGSYLSSPRLSHAGASVRKLCPQQQVQQGCRLCRSHGLPDRLLPADHRPDVRRERLT